MSKPSVNSRLSQVTLLKMKESGEKIAALTCYDSTMAEICDQAGVDLLLVGDSLGMVLQGHSSTLPVKLSDVCYHVKAVASKAKRPLIMADLPFGSFEMSPEAAYNAAVKLIKAGAQMVKIEGGENMVETTKFLSQRGIAVCAHVGLRPQYINMLGGYLVQGKDQASANEIEQSALSHQAAGASVVLIEAVPANLSSKITAQLKIPTIGIGAGPDCSGQVLVIYDMLGFNLTPPPKFVKSYFAGAESPLQAIANYVLEVKSGKFPSFAESYKPVDFA